MPQRESNKRAYNHPWSFHCKIKPLNNKLQSNKRETGLSDAESLIQLLNVSQRKAILAHSVLQSTQVEWQTEKHVRKANMSQVERPLVAVCWRAEIFCRQRRSIVWMCMNIVCVSTQNMYASIVSIDLFCLICDRKSGA